MRKFLLSLALVLCTTGAMAQEMPRLTAEELNNVVERLPIAIRCTQKDYSNNYYNGNGRSSGFSIENVFYWVPVENGVAGEYYIMNGNDQYLQKPTGNNATDFYTFGEESGAVKLHAICPTNEGTDNAHKFTEIDLVWDEDDDYIVRIAVTDNSRWLNIEKLSTTGIGIWTVQNVYNVETYLVNFVNEWQKNTIQSLGYVGGYPKTLINEIEAVTKYEQTVAFEAANEKIAINTNSYYRLVCVAPKTGNSGDVNYNTLTFNGASNLVTAPTSTSNINQIFKFEDAGNGHFYLKNMNADGYLNKIQAGPYRSTIVTQTDACKLELQAYAAMAQWKLQNSESANTNHSLFAENKPSEEYGAAPYSCAGWNGGANSASAWYIIPAEDIELTINEFASVYLPFAVEVEGAKAYAVTETTETETEGEGYAVLTEKSDIPANQGAILEGNGTVKLNIISEATADWTGNKLSGSTIDTYLNKTAYVLAKDNDVIGFYKAALNCDETGAEGETHFKNNANKAYLAVDGAEGIASYSFRFGEGTTGVENVVVENGVKAIFDLTGRRVEAITAPGIYIVNGKKVLVK